MAVEFKQTQLANGLTIVAEINDDAHTAAAGFFVKAGTRDEPLELVGVSHFLEHMMFKGTPRRTADEVNRDFDRIGANYNASTSQETTTYYAHVLPEYLPEAIDLLADILRPSLRQEDFEMEKQVILEEIGMYADRPFWVAYEEAMQRFYGQHSLGYRILGTNESIQALSRDQMEGYFRERYSPDNIVVSLAGKLDFQRCVDQIESLCSSWERTHISRAYHAPTQYADDQTIWKSTVRRHYLVTIANGPSRQDESRYAAAVLANLLGDADGSRLYWKLIDPGLADEVEVSHQPFDQTGSFMAYLSCDPARRGEVESILTETLENVAADLTEDEIERARNKIAMDLMLQNERPAGRMMSLGGTWLYLGRHLPLEEVLHKVMAVDIPQVRDLLAGCNFAHRTTVRMTPGEAESH